MPAAYFLGLRPGLMLAQHPDDLLLAEATAFHCPSPFSRRTLPQFCWALGEQTTPTELKANSYSGGCERTSTRNFSNICARFPSERLLATPTFLIPLAPASRYKPSMRFGEIGKSPQFRDFAK